MFEITYHFIHKESDVIPLFSMAVMSQMQQITMKGLKMAVDIHIAI
jgi:hypothetical protein